MRNLRSVQQTVTSTTKSRERNKERTKAVSVSRALVCCASNFQEPSKRLSTNKQQTNALQKSSAIRRLFGAASFVKQFRVRWIGATFALRPADSSADSRLEQSSATKSAELKRLEASSSRQQQTNRIEFDLFACKTNQKRINATSSIQIAVICFLFAAFWCLKSCIFQVFAAAIFVACWLLRTRLKREVEIICNLQRKIQICTNQESRKDLFSSQEDENTLQIRRISFFLSRSLRRIGANSLFADSAANNQFCSPQKTRTRERRWFNSAFNCTKFLQTRNYLLQRILKKTSDLQLDLIRF